MTACNTELHIGRGFVLRAYGSALVGYFQQWKNGLRKGILCSTWTPQEKGIKVQQKQYPTNRIRKVALTFGTLWRPRTKLHKEILNTGVLHKEMCVQSLKETVKCRDKGKNKKMLQDDAFL